jgi:hypothetical protein
MKLKSGKETDKENMAENTEFQAALDHVEVSVNKDSPSSNVRVEIFTLHKWIEPRLWLTRLHFLCQLYTWNDEQIVKNVVFYLGDEMWTWYKEKAESKVIKDWQSFEEQFLKYVEFQGNSFGRKLDLDGRKMKPGENLLSYLTDVSNLCQRVDPKMSVETSCYYVLKGLPDWLTSGLLSRDFKKIDDLWDKLKGRVAERDLRNRLYGESSRTASTNEVPIRKREDYQSPRWSTKNFSGDARGYQSSGRISRPLNEVTCWTCNEKGHLCYSCPNEKVPQNSINLN